MTGRLGAPLLNGVQFCSRVQCPLWGMCGRTHACLNSVSLLSLGRGPQPCAHCAGVHLPPAVGSPVGRLLGWVGPFLSRRAGTLHISVPGSCFCYSVHIFTHPADHYCSPRSTIYSYSVCPCPYYCQHIQWFSKAYRHGLGLCQPCCLDVYMSCF